MSAARRSGEVAGDREAPLEQPVPPKPPVSIKGRDGGLRIAVTEPGAPPAELEASLAMQLERRSGAFFAGAPVMLELPSPLDMGLAARLARVVESAGMALVGVVAAEAGRRLTRAGDPAATPPSAAVAPEAALLVARTLRSGQRVVHAGAVVVLGDVNAGAEVVAGGSVIVWGRLRGMVEAGGAEGSSTVVCALDLAPTQLRLGPAIARAPEEPGRQPVPEVARLVDGRIVVDEWR